MYDRWYTPGSFMYGMCKERTELQQSFINETVDAKYAVAVNCTMYGADAYRHAACV